MKNAWVSGARMVALIGAIVLSAGLVLMADRASADKGDNDRGSATDLSGVTQNWDKNLPNGSRFTVLPAFANMAVRDNNTGLVWEQAPDVVLLTWGQATSYCVNKTVGGTVGWRLPSVVELKSVQDPSLLAPVVPAVFTGVQSAPYWSASSLAESPDGAWLVSFNAGFIDFNGKTVHHPAWCVRGAMNADTY